MNRIELLGQQVSDLMEQLDQDIVRFRAWSGLGCAFGCGRCCLKPDIEAAPLEFLPFALAVHREGALDQWLDRLEGASGICVIFDEDQTGAGKCSRYPHRGLICRLFGFAARRNKYGRKELVTCTIIKTEQTSSFTAAESAIADDEKSVPVFTDYYDQLRDLDDGLGGRYVPVNQAIRIALETVSAYFRYEAGEEPV